MRNKAHHGQIPLFPCELGDGVRPAPRGHRSNLPNLPAPWPATPSRATAGPRASAPRCPGVHRDVVNRRQRGPDPHRIRASLVFCAPAGFVHEQRFWLNFCDATTLSNPPRLRFSVRQSPGGSLGGGRPSRSTSFKAARCPRIRSLGAGTPCVTRRSRRPGRRPSPVRQSLNGSNQPGGGTSRRRPRRVGGAAFERRDVRMSAAQPSSAAAPSRTAGARPAAKRGPPCRSLPRTPRAGARPSPLPGAEPSPVQTNSMDTLSTLPQLQYALVRVGPVTILLVPDPPSVQ